MSNVLLKVVTASIKSVIAGPVDAFLSVWNSKRASKYSIWSCSLDLRALPQRWMISWGLLKTLLTSSPFFRASETVHGFFLPRMLWSSESISVYSFRVPTYGWWSWILCPRMLIKKMGRGLLHDESVIQLSEGKKRQFSPTRRFERSTIRRSFTSFHFQLFL